MTAALSRICIIGAGGAGLAALREIAESREYQDGLWSVDCFEEREDLGGIWLPAPNTDHPPFTPLYDSLTTNLPHPVMGYARYIFPQETPLFPVASLVETYLRDYAEHFGLTKFIRFKTAVTKAYWDVSKSAWVVTRSDGNTDSFELLIVANGHHRVPRYPSVDGLEAWIAQGKIMHAVYYRKPPSDRNLPNLVYLVVGGGPSGQDVCADLIEAGCKKVYHSNTHAAKRPPGNEGVVTVGRLVAFDSDPQSGRVTFEDGATISGVDQVILATGYKVSFPFFEERTVTDGYPPSAPLIPTELHNSGYHIYPLARQLWPVHTNVQHPVEALAFMGLTVKGVPLPLFEIQIKSILAAFRQPSLIDVPLERKLVEERYRMLSKQHDGKREVIARHWHVLQEDETHSPLDYRDELSVLCHLKDRVTDWEHTFYDAKGALRSRWREIERRGEASKWLRGVGSGGIGDWVSLMQRLLDE